MRDAKRPTLAQVADRPGRGVVQAVHPRLGTRYLYCDGDVPLLFTENETNTQRIFGVPNPSAYVKDGINDYIVDGRDGRGESGEDRDHRRGALPADHRPGRVARGAPAAVGCRTRCARTHQERARQSVRRRLRSGGRQPS